MAQGIIIVGLGPGRSDQLTLEAWRILESAGEVYLRTARHPTVAELPAATTCQAFDAVYESAETFEAVYEQIAQQVFALGQREQGVIYAVPGHPLVGETTVLRIRQLAAENHVPVRIVAGLSFIEPTLTALGIDPFDGLQLCDAMVLAQRLHPSLDPDVAALIGQVYSRDLASELKMTLMHLYPDDHPVRLVYHAGLPEGTVQDIALYQLDRQAKLDHLTSAYLPPLAAKGSLSSYQEVLARLRAPDGCPWDREQTHESLRTSLLEETYEVLDALDRDDMGDLKEELGDLLLQVLFHAQIANEDGDFRLADSMRYTIEKLERRHPHVFGDQTVEDSEEVLRNWEQIKRQERGTASFTSMLAGLNKALPALSQAHEMQRRVARVGFDWPTVDPVLAKVREELTEFLAAPQDDARAAELGDLLFSMVNLARWYTIDPESALREANQRFARRFAVIEQAALAQGRPLEEMTLEEMDAIWDRAKAQGL
jgi:tetrapyrrole methylase family protein/MazG family protein